MHEKDYYYETKNYQIRKITKVWHSFKITIC